MRYFQGHWLEAGATACYGLLVAATAFHHEPWADEAQAWLLARDSSLIEIWTRLLHYEGTPGLWHTLLHPLASAGAPYITMHLLAGLLGVAGAWLLMRYAPLPKLLRLLLPFTFFLSYQYAVVARSYSLLPPLLFGCAILYPEAERRLGLFTCLLVLMAGVSSHGLALSAAIWLTFGFRLWARRLEFAVPERRRMTVWAVFYLAMVMCIVLASWPSADVTFPTQRNLSFDSGIQVILGSLGNAFTGVPVLSLVVVACSLPFLYKGGGLPVFAVSAALLLGLAVWVHSQVWHHGLILLGWLFSIWISAQRVKPNRLAIAALTAVLAVQGYWTGRAVLHDWFEPYSGSLAAARYIKDQGLESHRIYAAGYPTTAVQPYFTRNPFANLHSQGFWDWSGENRANDPAGLFREPAYDYVLAGYKNIAERAQWAKLTQLAGYETERHFEGNLFWAAGVLEPEAFDLYRRGEAGGQSGLSNLISMGESASERQLLSGFHAAESGWRWVGPRCSLVLRVPDEARTRGARLEFRFALPEHVIRELGTVTLQAEANEEMLAPETFSAPGNHVYARDLPPRLLTAPAVAITFIFDKAIPPKGAEARELAAIALSAGLNPKR